MLTLPAARFRLLAKILTFTFLLAMVSSCGGGGAKSSEPVLPTEPSPTTKVTDLTIKPTPAKVKSDDSNTSAVKIRAFDAGGGIVAGATIRVTTATGILVPGTVVTDSTGTATVDFSSGTSDIATRFATIVATSNGVSVQAVVQINGSTVEVTTPITSLPDNGSTTTTLTVLVKDAGGNVATGIPVTLSQAGGGGVSLTPTSGNTDSNGQFVATIAGLRPGSTVVTITAIGETRTQSYTVTPTSTNSFNIDQQTLNGNVIANNDVTPIKIGDSLAIQVNAPGLANVVFATTQGGFSGFSTVTRPVSGGKATATFTSASAGVATIQVLDPNNPTVSTDTLTVAITSAVLSAAKITLQAAPNVVGISSGGIFATSSLIATVSDANGNPVGGAAVAFKIVAGTGGGEQISPVVQLTNTTSTGGLSLGQAKAIFTSGSLPSSQGGVKIRATVVDVANVETRDPDPAADPCPICGLDAAITIGGAPASISIGQPSDFSDSADHTLYLFPMSVFVSDASGRGVPGITVSLSAFPIAWSTSINNAGGAYGCGFDLDDGINRGTFLNEDVNEDFILDASTEDGVRKFYANGTLATGTPTNKDNKITAPPADGGVLPDTVTTDANGIASYTLRYPKSSAFHIIDRIRASTIVQGTETVGELRFRLPALKIDASPTECHLPPSPYIF